MSGTVAHKLLIILVLATVAKMPLPWVHRHADVERSRLAAHLEAQHHGEFEWELPIGWHVHFLIPGFGSECEQKNGLPGDSKDGPGLPDEVRFCETVFDAGAITKLADYIAAFSAVCTSETLELPAGFIGTVGNARARSQGFAESGQWRYALTVLLI